MSVVRVTAPITSMSFVPAPTVPLSAYSPATDTIVDLRGMKTKGLLVKNTGSNSITYQVNGSYDDGVTFDIPVQTNTVVASAGQSNYTDTNCYTHWQIRVMASTASTAGTSTSGSTPATSVLAGSTFSINVDGDGARSVYFSQNFSSGNAIAAAIQSIVRDMLANNSNNQAAYNNFTAAYTGGAYVLTSGAIGSSSSVVVTAGLQSDVSASLKLGAANGGTEVAGTSQASSAQIKLVALGI